MSEHHAKILWERTTTDFDYESYSRDHSWAFDGELVIPASAAPDFKGASDRLDPEESFVASLSSSHMLTFLALAARRRQTVDRYEDRAVGVLEKNEEGVLAVTTVTLKPDVTFAEGVDVTPEQLQKLHHKAHEHCFIANSVKTRVTIE